MKTSAVAVSGMLLLAMLPLSGGATSSSISINAPDAAANEVTNISVEDTWTMLHNESDGRELVVDVRTFAEWFNERIDTPHSYDSPILYPLHFIEIPLFRQLFHLAFQGNEVILYCRSANRSYIAGTTLVDEGFQGRLYNMEGGIIAWKAANLPVVTGLGFGS